MKIWLRGLRKLVPPLPALALAGVIALAVGFGLILWIVPQWQTPADLTDPQARANFENEARRTIAQILLGALVLVGLYFTWRRVRAADQTVEVSREQQITERFTRAVEQLGSDNLAIRLGGIYALERIARDSAMDHWQVMEVLTAYVRENAPRWEGELDEHGVPVSDDSGHHRVPTDIQAILTELGRRDSIRETEVQRLDLTDTDLRDAELGGYHLERVIFRDAHLNRAYLVEALLEGSDLVGAHLEGAHLVCANLRGADLGNTYLDYAYLMGADLTKCLDLNQEQIDSAITDENTILPDYLRQG